MKELLKIRKEVEGISLPAKLNINEEVEKITNFKRICDAVFDGGRKGQDIQRYKGLGEMNPGQLWDTTLDPENRTLLKVKVDDAVEADSIFTVLMGDQVEPRREFIEKNALNVRNLDI